MRVIAATSKLVTIVQHRDWVDWLVIVATIAALLFAVVQSIRIARASTAANLARKRTQLTIFHQNYFATANSLTNALQSVETAIAGDFDTPQMLETLSKAISVSSSFLGTLQAIEVEQKDLVQGTGSLIEALIEMKSDLIPLKKPRAIEMTVQRNLKVVVNCSTSLLSQIAIYSGVVQSSGIPEAPRRPRRRKPEKEVPNANIEARTEA